MCCAAAAVSPAIAAATGGYDDDDDYGSVDHMVPVAFAGVVIDFYRENRTDGEKTNFWDRQNSVKTYFIILFYFFYASFFKNKPKFLSRRRRLRRSDLIYTPYATAAAAATAAADARSGVPPPSCRRHVFARPLAILYLERGFQNASDPATAATTVDAGPTTDAHSAGCTAGCIPAREGRIPLETKTKTE